MSSKLLTLFRGNTTWLAAQPSLQKSCLLKATSRKLKLLHFDTLTQMPDVMTPVCACGDGRETARHVAAYCQLEEITRRELPFAMRTHRDFDTAVKDPTRAASLTRWLMRRQRVGGYRVALQIADSEEPVVTPPARRQPRWSSWARLSVPLPSLFSLSLSFSLPPLSLPPFFLLPPFSLLLPGEDLGRASAG